MSNSLFHLTQEYLHIANILEENGGELTPELEEALEFNQEAVQVKGVNIAFVIKKYDSEIEPYQKEIERLQKAVKAKENAKERLKSYLKSNMERLGITEIKGEIMTIRLQNSRSAVEIVDKDSIPKKFLNKKIDVVPDKKAIKEALDSGQKVKGVELKESKSLILK